MDKAAIGDGLRILRIDKKLTQSEVAYNIMTVRHYRDIENGRSSITDKDFLDILAAMNATMDDFTSVMPRLKQKNIFEIQHQVNNISQYLLEVNEFYDYEVDLFKQVLPGATVKTIVRVLPQILQRNMDFNLSRQQLSTALETSIHAITRLLILHDNHDAAKFINRLDPLSDDFSELLSVQSFFEYELIHAVIRPKGKMSPEMIIYVTSLLDGLESTTTVFLKGILSEIAIVT
ncbi:helix-turn-helix domain-containing protein [Lapidilactobacillus gannanensis]|uniref:Helix-turn-helix domain-containing protein n=1 Tax=Lapidilactobacillus gannanensis TaxID=2486002 RepID=A0ABW4BN69_9LACO|nr:helix-turn-helix transcriptional regulator [Lapidilactobacillus gannanensis]